MLMLVALYVYVLCQGQKNAKEHGEEALNKWRVKTVSRHLWILTGILLVYSVAIGYSPETFFSDHMCLRWEAVLLAFLGIMVAPPVILRLWCINRTVSVLLPILCAMAVVLYIPFSTGCDFIDTIAIICVGAVSIFFVGYVVLCIAVAAVILVMVLVGLFSIPVVYTI